MPSTQVDPGHNTVALSILTGEFSFAPGATTAAEAAAIGYIDIGNVKSINLALDPTKLEHFGSYRGVKRNDKTVVTQTKLAYTLVCDELNQLVTEILLGATSNGDFSQPAFTAVNGTAFAFGTTAAVIGRWYDITAAATTKITAVGISSGGTGYAVNDVLMVAGGTGTSATLTVTSVSSGVITALSITTAGAYTSNPSTPNTPTGGTGSGASITLTFGALTAAGDRLKRLTTVTITSLTEGTDFEVDLTLARIRFLTAQSTNRTPIITCSAITADSSSGASTWTPLEQPVKSGFGRLIMYDTETGNQVVFDHSGFSCDVSVDSVSDIDGESFAEVTLTVTVTATIGTYDARNLNRTSGMSYGV